ncbi:MAG: tetratricopeptide repeat protein [Planctomycetaceae bacterium]|jgi:tetratricopeptide (TPR) repeat protein|nr:tetratricopeptide repeat protein [Planctomycetaceae bacterium]
MTHDEKLKTAQTALISGDTARAEELYQEILRSDSSNLYALDGLGILRCQNGNPNEGIEYFLEALHQLEISAEKNSTTLKSQAVLKFHLGLAYRTSGHNHEAVNIFCESRKLDPNNTDLILNLGQLYFELDQREEAIACFKNITELQPENASAWLTLGYLYTLRNSHAEAIPVLSEAVRLDPASAEACFFLAESLRKEEQFEESILYYQRLFPVGMEWTHAIHGCGQSLLALGDFENGWDAMEFRLVNTFGTWERHHLPNWNRNSDNNSFDNDSSGNNNFGNNSLSKNPINKVGFENNNDNITITITITNKKPYLPIQRKELRRILCLRLAFQT